MKIFAVLVNHNDGSRNVDLVKKLVGYRSLEKIILVDNSSTDGSLQKIPKNKKVSIIKKDDNLGFGKAVNIGAIQALSEGADKIILINPDASITNFDILKLGKTTGDIVGPVLTFTRDGQTIKDYGGKVNLLIGRATHCENEPNADDIDYVSGACILISSKVFKEIGFLGEEYFIYYEDADFGLRAKKAGLKVVINKNVIVPHEISEHKFSRNSWKLNIILDSNRKFIVKWVPWYSKPVALGYLALLKFKSSRQQ